MTSLGNQQACSANAHLTTHIKTPTIMLSRKPTLTNCSMRKPKAQGKKPERQTDELRDALSYRHGSLPDFTEYASELRRSLPGPTIHGISTRKTNQILDENSSFPCCTPRSKVILLQQHRKAALAVVYFLGVSSADRGSSPPSVNLTPSRHNPL